MKGRVARGGLTDGDDSLKHELPLADDRCSTGPVVGVLPLQRSVNLVHADSARLADDFSSCIDQVAAEVVDQTKAITADCVVKSGEKVSPPVAKQRKSKGRLTRQVVGRSSSTNVTEIERALSVERVSRVSVRNCGERAEPRTSVPLKSDEPKVRETHHTSLREKVDGSWIVLGRRDRGEPCPLAS